MFVSHSHFDNSWCRDFVAALTDLGCDVWYDEHGLGGGAIWRKRIVAELQSRPRFVVILSPDATNSQWVDEEIQLAHTAQLDIIPVLYHQTTINDMLAHRQLVDVRGLTGLAAAQRVTESVLATTHD